MLSQFPIRQSTITAPFRPVRGRPLWKEPRPLSDDNVTSQQIWHRFENVYYIGRTNEVI